MVTASEVIGFAYREANFKDISATPSTREMSEGLTMLQGIVNSLHGIVVGVRPVPWYIPARPGRFNDTPVYPTKPPQNARLLLKVTSDTTVELPLHPDDGAMIEYIDIGQTAGVVLDANGGFFGLTGEVTEVEIDATIGRNAPRRWVYRGDYGSWLEMTGLTLASDLPFPESFTDYFITELAMRLSPRFGADPRAVTLQRNQRMHQFISGMWVQSRGVVVGNAGLPTAQSYETPGFSGDFGGGLV